MPSLNMPVQRLKIAIPGPVTHSGEILTTDRQVSRKEAGQIKCNIREYYPEKTHFEAPLLKMTRNSSFKCVLFLYAYDSKKLCV